MMARTRKGCASATVDDATMIAMTIAMGTRWGAKSARMRRGATGESSS